MKPDDIPDNFATLDDVRQAIEVLSHGDWYRLQKAAAICLTGTEYRDRWDIINEAFARTISAANGGKGRRWPKDVPFMAYMLQTFRGLADDSRASSVQKKLVNGGCAGDLLGRSKQYDLDVVAQAVDIEETQERQDRAKRDADIIDKRFEGDNEVTWIIMGLKDGQSAAAIREMAGMTDTQYNTARRRFRRGLEKLFPDRRAS